MKTRKDISIRQVSGGWIISIVRYKHGDESDHNIVTRSDVTEFVASTADSVAKIVAENLSE